MNRAEAIALQRRGIRVEEFPENCGHCGRPSVYRRREDRYFHDDPLADNLPCWLAISQGCEPEPVVSQRDSRTSPDGSLHTSLATLR